MDELGWKAGDEIRIDITEICDDNGECNGFVLRNITKDGEDYYENNA